jgi:hypothetical protein
MFILADRPATASHSTRFLGDWCSGCNPHQVDPVHFPISITRNGLANYFCPRCHDRWFVSWRLSDQEWLEITGEGQVAA